MLTKVLEKKMTYSEAVEYVSNNKKWRFPNIFEITDKNFTFWVHNQYPNIHDLYRFSTGNVSHNLVKHKVVLVQNLIDVISGVVYHVEKSKFGKDFIDMNGTGVFDLHKIVLANRHICDNFANIIIDSMNENDLLHIKE